MTRIIAGSAGGRRLRVPAGRSTRPTADRAREALFSALEALRGPLAGAAFLDLYAGSGAVGLEAASRGAARVVLVESAAPAVAAIRANAAVVGAEVDLRVQPVERFLAGPPPMQFDVVFADPPYAVPVDAPLVALATAGWVRAGGVVVVERASRDAPPAWPAAIEPVRAKRYGEATLWYGRRS